MYKDISLYTRQKCGKDSSKVAGKKINPETICFLNTDLKVIFEALSQKGKLKRLGNVSAEKTSIRNLPKIFKRKHSIRSLRQEISAGYTRKLKI